jgi:hypothetical protein
MAWEMKYQMLLPSGDRSEGLAIGPDGVVMSNITVAAP